MGKNFKRAEDIRLKYAPAKIQNLSNGVAVERCYSMELGCLNSGRRPLLDHANSGHLNGFSYIQTQALLILDAIGVHKLRRHASFHCCALTPL